MDSIHSAKINYAVAQAIAGAADLHNRGDNEGFEAALSFFSRDGKKARMAEGFQFISAGYMAEGLEAIAESMTADASAIKNILLLLRASAGGKHGKPLEIALGYMRDIKRVELSALNPEKMQELTGTVPSLPLLDEIAVRMKKPEAGAIALSFPKNPELSEKQKLGLALSVFLDDIAYKYFSSHFTADSRRYHDFFFGLASYAFPLERREDGVFAFDEKIFQRMSDYYGLEGDCAGKMSRAYDAFASFAAFRMPFLASVPERVVSGLVESISDSDEIRIPKSSTSNLAKYDFFPYHRELIEIIMKRVELARKNDDEEIRKLDMRGTELIRIFEPGIKAPYLIGLDMANARNFIAQANDLALALCSGIEGKLNCRDAVRAVTAYSGIYDFDKKRIIGSVSI